MTLRARRWYYSIAILIFCLAAPLIVATASGWRWSGWRQGFIGTGTLIVKATPRATLTLNSQVIGNTPKRVSGLAPGAYQLSLTRPGFTTWSHLIRIKERTSSTIGPVRLFREPLATTTLTNDMFSGFVVSPDQHVILGWTTTGLSTTGKILWPSLRPGTLALPTAPDWVVSSPRQQWLAVGSPEATLIYPTASGAPLEPWSLPPGGPVAWLSSSEAIFYRLEGGQIIGYDLLLRTRSALQPAEAIASHGERLWFTSYDGANTALAYRLNTVAAQATTVATLAGSWQVVGALQRGAFVANSQTGIGELITINRVTSRVERTSVGGVSAVGPDQPTPMPLWSNGVELVTLTNKRQPMVLVRSPLTLTDAEWVDSGDILATLDPASLHIRSVSSQQGRGTLVSFLLPEGTTPLVLEVGRQSAIVALDGRLQRLSWE